MRKTPGDGLYSGTLTRGCTQCIRGAQMVLFNEERFWEVHEVVEGEWKKAEGEEKEILQGIILYAAAYVHHQKNEKETALRMLRRAVEKLGVSSDIYFCFDLGKMREMERTIAAKKNIEIFRL